MALMHARRLTSLRLALLTAAGALLLLAAPRTASAEPPPDAASWLFDPTAVARIELSLPPASIAALEAEPDEYQPGALSLRGVGGDLGPLDVGIRLKGGGSFRPLTGKSAFKVKLDEYVDGQTLLGLRKLTLNNMIQDPSMIHETLAYEAFRAAGVPASRTGYAFLTVNGEDYGLYLNLEVLDKVSLPRLFASTRHLYEAGYATDVRPGGAAEYEVDEGKKTERADLEALIAAANGDSGDWSDGVAPFADLDEMTSAWAVERYIGHWDGYAGRISSTAPNNYYLHSDDSGLFTMLPWGTDQTWDKRLPFDAEGGLLLNRCLGDAGCAALYREAVRRVRDSIAGLSLPRRIDEIVAAIRPWQLADPRGEQGFGQFDIGIARVRQFVARRPGDAAAWLGELPGPAAEPALTAVAPLPDLPPGQGVAAVAKRHVPLRGAHKPRHRKCRRKAPDRSTRDRIRHCARLTAASPR
jgi:CotH protein